MHSIDPQLWRHVRAELVRLLRELEEGPGGEAVYGPQPLPSSGGGHSAKLGGGGGGSETVFPDDPAAIGLPRSGVYPDDWPQPLGSGGDRATCSVLPFVTKRPLCAHPLALVLHASVLDAALDETERDDAGYPLARRRGGSCGRGGKEHADGASPIAVVGGEEYWTARDLFMAVGRRCSAVLCCRVSPRQKAQVVAAGKHGLSPPGGAPLVTLAIGDGANDVPMIKEAHIGIGISGHEGMQATLASDYAIAQFRYLERLLLVHGRCCYLRMSKMVLYFLYKSIVFSLTMCWMSVFNGFSGHSIYDGNIASGFNLIFSFFPVIVLACVDRDIPTDEQMLRHPSLYAASQGGYGFSVGNFMAWALAGCWHSIVLFFGSAIIFDSTDGLGRSIPIEQLGIVVFGLVHVTVHLKLLLSFANHTMPSTAAMLFSLATWFVVWPVYTEVYTIAWTMNPGLWRSHSGLWQDIRWPLALVCLPTICCIPDVALKYAGRHIPEFARESANLLSLPFAAAFPRR